MDHLPTARHTGSLATLVAALAVTLLAGSVALHTQGRATLDIYWIDVEGGAATLVVTPERDTVLMDTGWPRPDARDAGRIQAAMRDAGITEIDYLLISHFHRDHVGGLGALAARVPIGEIVDHGDSVGTRPRAGSDNLGGLPRGGGGTTAHGRTWRQAAAPPDRALVRYVTRRPRRLAGATPAESAV